MKDTSEKQNENKLPEKEIRGDAATQPNIGDDGKFSNYVWYLLPKYNGYYRIIKDELKYSKVLPPKRAGDVSRDPVETVIDPQTFGQDKYETVIEDLKKLY